MTRPETERFTRLLHAKQEEIFGALRHRDEIVIEKASDALDEVQQMGERELAVRNLDRDSSLLRQIRRALDRAAHGAYGICLHCEEEIMPRRLAALPWAAYCIRCQEKIDRLEIEIDEHSHLLAPAA
jgi:DnaK suppressor protein